MDNSADHQAWQATPPKLTPKMPLPEAARSVLRESFRQFTANLDSLRTTDDPEVVHQARVGWRRFRTALRLFKKVEIVKQAPSWLPLKPVLLEIGALRDLDVARLETLPPLAEGYMSEGASCQGHWQALDQALIHAANEQHKTLLIALEQPENIQALQSITKWLDNKAAWKKSRRKRGPHKKPLRSWAKRQVLHWHQQLKAYLLAYGNPESQHMTRIMAKRLRYGMEALHPLLPKRPANRWLRKATKLQANMGAERDLQQACSIATQLATDPLLVAYLHGAASAALVTSKHQTRARQK